MEDNDNSLLIREDKILNELKQLRRLFTVLMGTEDLPSKEKYSRAALTKAASEFRKMQAIRGEWIPSDEIDKVIKHAGWGSHKIIIEQFKFRNYFKRGSTYYFKKKDLIDLGNELKKRNINLEKYNELLRDQEKFQKYVDSIHSDVGTKSRRRFKIPDNLQDINSKPYTPPNEELIRNEIQTLLEEFDKFDLSEYVDLYENKTYAMFKFVYQWDRYLEPNIKKHSKNWCFKFNYANDALKKILKLKRRN